MRFISHSTTSASVDAALRTMSHIVAPSQTHNNYQTMFAHHPAIITLVRVCADELWNYLRRSDVEGQERRMTMSMMR